MMLFTITTKMHKVLKNKLKMWSSYVRNHVTHRYKRKHKQRKPRSWKKKQQKHVTGSVRFGRADYP